MSVERLHEQRVPAQALLVEAIISEHRKLVLRRLGQHGVNAASWDDLSGDIAAQRIDTILAPNSDANYAELVYGNENDQTIMSTEHNPKSPSYPLRILGSDSIQLLESAEPLEYMETTGPYRVKLRYSEELRVIIDSRAKYLDVRLLKEGSPHGTARIYMAPDIPPVAVHSADMDYIDRLDGSVPLTIRQSYRAIDRVTKAFGTEAVEYLSDETCEQLMAALQSAPKKFVMES